MSTIAEAEKAVEFNVFYAKRNVVDSIWKEAIIESERYTATHKCGLNHATQ